MVVIKLTSEDLTLLALRGDKDTRPALQGLTVVINPDGTGRVLASNGFVLCERELQAKAIKGADGQLHELNVAIPAVLTSPCVELTIEWTPGETSVLLQARQWATRTDLLPPSGVLSESLWPAGLPQAQVTLAARLLHQILVGLPADIGQSLSLRVFGKEEPVEFRLSGGTRGLVKPMLHYGNPDEWHPRPAENVSAVNNDKTTGC